MYRFWRCLSQWCGLALGCEFGEPPCFTTLWSVSKPSSYYHHAHRHRFPRNYAFSPKLTHPPIPELFDSNPWMHCSRLPSQTFPTGRIGNKIIGGLRASAHPTHTEIDAPAFSSTLCLTLDALWFSGRRSMGELWIRSLGKAWIQDSALTLRTVWCC
ncbi:hypothetical protein F5141DRAFT_1140179, partial [Pisolithus sp. B1]